MLCQDTLGTSTRNDWKTRKLPLSHRHVRRHERSHHQRSFAREQKRHSSADWRQRSKPAGHQGDWATMPKAAEHSSVAASPPLRLRNCRRSLQARIPAPEAAVVQRRTRTTHWPLVDSALSSCCHHLFLVHRHHLVRTSGAAGEQRRDFVSVVRLGAPRPPPSRGL